MKFIQKYLLCSVKYPVVYSLKSKRKYLTVGLLPVSTSMKLFFRTSGSNSNQISNIQGSSGIEGITTHAKESIGHSLSTVQNNENEKCSLQAVPQGEMNINFQEKAVAYALTVNEALLNHKQIEIHRAHLNALQKGESFYKDPITGYQVMSRLAHLRRGDCCGNACRHCPYGQRNAPSHRLKKHNSAFYE